MFVLLWQFRPRPGGKAEFERAHGPDGPWVELFRQGDGYLGTELLRSCDEPPTYLTLDRWVSAEAYERFRARFSASYEAVDRELAPLADAETPIGAFEGFDAS